MSTILDKLISALRQTGLEFGAEQLADSMWLAPYLTPRPPDQVPDGHATKPEAPKKPPEPKKESVADDKKQTEPVSNSGGKLAVDAQLTGSRGTDAAPGAARGLPVGLSGAASLPEALAIARALRPLRKRIATTRWFRLDEKRTSERLASGDVWLPVMLPGRERWLNATIIVDTGASMAIWRTMVNEFRGIMQSLGAFRKIEVRRMDTDDPGDSVPIYPSGQSTARHNPLDLADPSGRTFFLIISDCVGSAWWDGRVSQLLELWGRTNHTAILQILPQAMWGRTALGAERTVTLTSPQAMCPNTNLAAFAMGKFRKNVKLNAQGLVPVPVLELGAASLAAWARDATSVTGAQFTGRLLRTKPTPPSPLGDDHWSQSLGEPFLTLASLPTRKLANLMAAAPPFNLPLLRVIRESRLSGEATQIHEAEFLLGGLVTAAPQKDERVNDPERVIYDFKSPQLRSMLRSAVHISEAIEVMSLEEVGEYLGQHLGRPGGFSAVFRAPQDYAGRLDLTATEDRDPIARFTVDMLRWFGGKYTELLSVKSDSQQSFTWGDHESAIWYVRSTFRGNEFSTRRSSVVAERVRQGSAVAVRLWRERETARTYLLTCAHVVDGFDTGVSPVLGTLQAWRAGTTFDDNHARNLRVVAIGNGHPDERVADDPKAESSDWALLEIEDRTESLFAPAIPYWFRLNAGDEVLACGYPGGDSDFGDGLVTPRIANQRLILSRLDHGLLKFQGDASRPGMSGAGVIDTAGRFVGIHRSWRQGMSGGPVMDTAGRLVGIHRSGNDATMELVALSADSIRQQLKEFGFHVVTDETCIELSPVEELVQILLKDERPDWREVLHRALSQFLTHSVPEVPVDDESLADALRELEKFGPSANEVRPLHEFVLTLNRTNPAKALREWINKHVPPEIQKAFETTNPNVPKSKVPTRPDICVLIAGTGSYELPPMAYETAERVGRWAADCGFALVTGGWQGVDHVAAREFADSLDRRNPIELWLTHVVSTGSEPDFKRGNVIKVQAGRQEEEYVRAINLARAVILVGGLGGTWNVAEHAVRMRVPVFPLPWTGGDAAQFHHEMLANWVEHEWMGIRRDRFEALSNPAEALDIIANHLRPTGQFPTNPPPVERPTNGTQELELAIAAAQSTIESATDPNLIQQALYRLKMASRAVPNDLGAAIFLCRLHRALNQLPEAITVLTSAIDANTNPTGTPQVVNELLYNRARCYAILGQSNAAFVDLSRWLQRAPHSANEVRDESEFGSLRDDPRFTMLLDNPRPYRVLIAGSDKGNTPRGVSNEFARYCRDLGAALARAGFGFVIGSISDDTADRHVIAGIVEAKVPVYIDYIRPRSESNQPEVELLLEKHVVNWELPDLTWRAVRPLQVNAADMVVVIGGYGGTEQIIETARSANKPLISVPSFPGAARVAWPAVRQELAKKGLNIPLIERLNKGYDEQAAVAAIQFCLSSPYRDPSGLLPVEEIRSALYRSGKILHDKQITGDLLLFDNSDGLRQHTWLVATRDKVFIVLDDERTRTNDRLVQWEVNRNSLLPLSFHPTKHTVGFGDHSGPRWYYSTTLFPIPDDLKAAVESLVAGS